MAITLFILNEEQKRRLIEIMLLIFSIIIVLPGKFNPQLYGTMPATFLFLALFCWLASYNQKVLQNLFFKLLVAIIVTFFSAMLSAELLASLTTSKTISGMIFWAYYLSFSLVLYLSLTSIENEFPEKRRYLKPLGKIILFVIFGIVIYFLSKLS